MYTTKILLTIDICRYHVQSTGHNDVYCLKCVSLGAQCSSYKDLPNTFAQRVLSKYKVIYFGSEILIVVKISP